MDGWNVHWPPPKNNTLAAGWFGLALIHGQDWCIAASKTIGMIDLPQEQHLSAGLIGACPAWRSRLGKPLQLRALTFMDPCVPSFAELDRRWNIHKTRPFIQAQMFAGRKRRYVVQEWKSNSEKNYIHFDIKFRKIWFNLPGARDVMWLRIDNPRAA